METAAREHGDGLVCAGTQGMSQRSTYWSRTRRAHLPPNGISVHLPTPVRPTSTGRC